MTYEELLDVVEAIERGDNRHRRLSRAEKARIQARPNALVQAIAPRENQLRIEDFTWGFPIDGGKKTVFNTRIESALQGSRMWGNALRDGRCILPVASFFEPHATETSLSPRTGKPVKRQYEFFGCSRERIGDNDESTPSDVERLPLLLASIHDGERLSVVTTEPNASVAPVHPRMPLVLRFEEVATWLHGDFATLADRSDIALGAQPETPAAPPSAQLSLFES